MLLSGVKGTEHEYVSIAFGQLLKGRLGAIHCCLIFVIL